MNDDERTPPTRIRTTRLQEAQLSDLVAMDQAAAARQYEAGVDPGTIRPRTDVEIAGLHRTHDVYVAEADHEVAGYLAWRDAPPKIAVVDILCVAPAFQRFGIASRLLRELGERCGELGIDVVVTRCPERADWATAFLKATGFQPVSDSDTGAGPAVVKQWREQHASPDELPRAGELLFWRPSEHIGMKVIPGVPLPA